jgi:hypothetical protein
MRLWIVRGLMPVMLVSGVAAETYVGKTFLAPRPPGVNKSLEVTTWHRQVRVFDQYRFGGTVELVPWYQSSTDKKKYGRYFGVRNPLRGNQIENFVGVSAAAADKLLLHPQDIIHYEQAARANNFGVEQNPLKDRVHLLPEQRVFGVWIAYHQELDMMMPGLYFKVNMPIVRVRNSLNAASGCGSGDCGIRLSGVPTSGNDGMQAPESVQQYCLLNYLSGELSNNDPTNRQAPLTKMRIITGGKSSSGVADIDVVLGYNFRWEQASHVGINIGFTVPTSNKPTGDYLWEPIYGNNQHWAIGAGFDSAVTLWCDEGMSLDVLLSLDYRYLFRNDEVRAPHFKTNAQPVNAGSGYTTMNAWQLYALGGKTSPTWFGDDNPTPLPLFPLANELARSFDVHPGGQFDLVAQLAFNWCGVTLDLGYELYIRGRERIHFPGGDCIIDTLNIAIADRRYRTTDPFNAAINTQNVPTNMLPDERANANGSPITTSSFDLNSMATPRQVTNKLYGGVGYAFITWEYPLMVGFYGSYEWASHNSALSQWAVGGKIGVTF